MGKVKREDREIRSQERRVIGQKVKMKVGVEQRGMEIGLDGEGGGRKGKKKEKKEVKKRYEMKGVKGPKQKDELKQASHHSCVLFFALSLCRTHLQSSVKDD